METSSNINSIIEDVLILKPDSENRIWIDNHCDTDDGTFPRVSDYTRRLKRMEFHGGAADILNWMGNRRMKFSMDGYSIARKDTVSSNAVIIFDGLIHVSMGHIFELNNEGFMVKKPVTSLINRIRGHFEYEFFWSKNGRQDKVANGFEIYFVCEQFEYINPFDKRKNKYFQKQK